MIIRHNHIQKTLWALAPLFWGIIYWFFIYGQGRVFTNVIVLNIVGVLAIMACFYAVLEYQRLRTRVQLFDFAFYFPDWRFLCFGSLMLLSALYFFPGDGVTILSSMALGVFAGPFFEELLSRAFFIKYEMKGIEFIFYNILSATAFTIMHAFYSMPMPTLYKLFFVNGHFVFACSLGILAYKTKRIEIPIIMHMASNFFQYTLPTLILHSTAPFWFIIPSFLLTFLVGGAVGLRNEKSSV